ncbi:hypothetical protein H0G86_000767 [Trichoderma simmonsii]|uniref:Uncharacterized protein n=1 Tax=Trichoderma simmonsii TaxID=1491479 RepID=A0A8G0L2H6_9HYPO|nr:hypothetical protein H0G86_000767 [Trichoderma simmonsii]
MGADNIAAAGRLFCSLLSSPESSCTAEMRDFVVEHNYGCISFKTIVSFVIYQKKVMKSRRYKQKTMSLGMLIYSAVYCQRALDDQLQDHDGIRQPFSNRLTLSRRCT